MNDRPRNRATAFRQSIASSLRTMYVATTKGALPWLLPAVVSGIAFAWFCTMPPYAPPSLPDKWDPECAEWKPEWKSLPTPPNSTIYRVREPDGDRENELLLRISDTSQFQLQRVSMSSSGGLNRQANQNQPAVNRDFQWATLFLPPELADLPEGIVE